MKFNPEDPQWTSFALGEVDASDRARMEAELAANPEIRRHVEELRATARKLKTILASEPALELRPEQRDTLQVQPVKSNVLHFPLRPLISLGIAASLVALIGFGIFQMKPTSFRMARLMEGSAGSNHATIEIAMLEPSASELEKFEKEIESVVTLPEMIDVDAPILADEIDLLAPSTAPTPGPQKENVELADLNVMNEFSPLVMRGLMAGRSSGGRTSALRAYGGKFSRREIAPAPSVVSPSQDDYEAIRENTFQRVEDHPLSTFSVDVDSASYAVVRRYLTDGQLPPKDAVRIEELINYFQYSYEPPRDGRPFAVHLNAAPCPWNPAHHLLRVALKARVLDPAARPPVNLVFLVDVSGSMSEPNKLPLVKRSLQALARQLDERDRLAIVVYAGAAGVVLPTTRGDQTSVIVESLEQLESGGSTAGGAGIELAYKTARAQFVTGGVNRVILCTDGDFNVGLNQRGDLERLIAEKAKSGVFLTVLGFGMGNLKDSTLEVLAGKGNGNHGYIDDFSEARRLLVDQMLGTLVAVAKDMKTQVEFNPARIEGYRLIGYENRMLRKEDFNNDKVDAGDVGAGHTVTAFYELIPVGQAVPEVGTVDSLKYQPDTSGAEAGSSAELLTAKLRYKLPDGETSARLDFPLLADQLGSLESARDFRFAAAVAGFGMILRDSPQRGTFTFADVLALAESDLGEDPGGYRRAFLNLVRNAQAVIKEPTRHPDDSIKVEVY